MTDRQKDFFVAGLSGAVMMFGAMGVGVMAFGFWLAVAVFSIFAIGVLLFGLGISGYLSEVWDYLPEEDSVEDV